MCERVVYLINYVIVNSLFLTSYEFYGHFYTDTESKSPYPLTSSTNLPSSSLSDFIVTPTPTPIG